MIIAEHGRYPRNERGHTLYPRYEFFRRVVEVGERSEGPGLQRQAPVEEVGMGQEMVDTARRWASRSWPARRCRSSGGSPRSKAAACRGRGSRVRRLRRAPTPTTSTPSRRCNAWWSVGVGARPAPSPSRPCAAMTCGRRWREAIVGGGGAARPRAVPGLPLPQLHGRLSPLPDLRQRPARPATEMRALVPQTLATSATSTPTA